MVLKPLGFIGIALLMVGVAFAVNSSGTRGGSFRARVAKGPLKVGPIDYFQQKCARCHGPYGDAYTDHFYAITDFEKLRFDVKRMADGAGMAPIEGDDLAAQVDYHKALIARGPFISWVEKDGQSLAGEVTKGATLVALVDGKELSPTVKRGHWKLELGAGVSASSVVLTATLDKKQATLKLAEGPWTTKVSDKR